MLYPQHCLFAIPNIASVTGIIESFKNVGSLKIHQRETECLGMCWSTQQSSHSLGLAVRARHPGSKIQFLFFLEIHYFVSQLYKMAICSRIGSDRKEPNSQMNISTRILKECKWFWTTHVCRTNSLCKTQRNNCAHKAHFIFQIPYFLSTQIKQPA